MGGLIVPLSSGVAEPSDLRGAIGVLRGGSAGADSVLPRGIAGAFDLETLRLGGKTGAGTCSVGVSASSFETSSGSSSSIGVIPGMACVGSCLNDCFLFKGGGWPATGGGCSMAGVATDIGSLGRRGGGGNIGGASSSSWPWKTVSSSLFSTPINGFRSIDPEVSSRTGIGAGTSTLN